MKTTFPLIAVALVMAGCVAPPPVVQQPPPAAPSIISRTVTSHPPAYQNKGRPAWTYDENRFHDDIQGEVNLVEELREPDKYLFFLGAQSVFVGNEENARSGALLDAINNFKAFLQTTGRNYLQERRGAGLGQQDIREFQTRMDAAATGVSRQLKPVRWYFEEERTEWSDGRVDTKWRGWCLAAFERSRADDLYKKLVERDFSAATPAASVADAWGQPSGARPLHVSASFEAFPEGEPVLNGITLDEARGVDRNPYYKKSMRFLQDGAYILASFAVEQMPANAQLRVVHLSSASASARNGGWSPVTITINGRTVVGDHSPSSHGYMTEAWNVGSLLRQGRNTIKFHFDNSQTHYWLQSFDIVGE